MLGISSPVSSRPSADEGDMAHRQKIRELFSDLSDCIPSTRPIDIVCSHLLKEALEFQVDWRRLACFPPLEPLPISLPPNQERELVALLDTASIDHLNAEDSDAVLEGPAFRIRQACISTKPAHNRSGALPSPRRGAAPGALLKQVYSEGEEETVSVTSSVKSAAGRIQPLLIPVRHVQALKKIKSAGSGLGRMRVNRDSLSGAGGCKLESAIDSLLSGRVLGKDELLTIGEAIESGSPSATVDNCFGLAAKLAVNIEQIDDKCSLTATGFVLSSIVRRFDALPESVDKGIPFSLDDFVIRALAKCKSATALDTLLECRAVVVALTALMRSGMIIDQSVFSAIACFVLCAIEDRALKKSVAGQCKTLFVQMMRAAESKQQILEELLESKASLADPSMAADYTLSCLTGLGDRSAGGHQLQLTKWLADVFWLRLVEQKGQQGGERRDFASAFLTELASSVGSKASYPSVSVAQQIVPHCIKGLSKDSALDVFTRGRLVDYLAAVVTSLKGPDSVDDDSVYSAEWLDLFDAWAAESSLGKAQVYSVSLGSTMLFKTADKLYAFLLSLAGSDAVSLRLKAIRAACQVPMDEQRKGALASMLALRLADPSPAVRDCSLELAGRDAALLSSHSLFESICSLLSVLGL